MTESFSGFVSIEDEDETLPIIAHTYKPVITNDIEDPKICMIREYLSKCPNATIKDIKNKALLHFSKPTDEELKELIKTANIDKYNELFQPFIDNNISSIILDKIPFGTPLIKEEIIFLEQNKHYFNNNEFIYNRYKSLFPNSERKIRFIRDYIYHEKIKHKKNYNQHQTPTTHIRFTPSTITHTIKLLYKAGFTPETLPKVKPVINELLAQNSSQDEIQLAIEFLKE
jgi:hypothetical protein